jgi:DNA mismatch endonuclease (patch repair protein)
MLEYPNPSSAAVSAVMRGNRRVDTGPERKVRSLLHARGYRYRTDYRLDVPGARVRPDIVFTRKRLAVFIDGCFWHCCPEHGTSPRANIQYWTAKLERNVARDHRVNLALGAAGWTVLRVWEHVASAEATRLIIASLDGDQMASSPPQAHYHGKARPPHIRAGRAT